VLYRAAARQAGRLIRRLPFSGLSGMYIGQTTSHLHKIFYNFHLAHLNTRRQKKRLLQNRSFRPGDALLW